MRGASPAAAASLVIVAVVTGLIAFATGTPVAAVPVTIHGMAGVAMVLLAVGAAIAGRGAGRAGRRTGSLLGILAALITLLSGFAHSSGVVARLGPLNLMQIHVPAGLVTLVIALLNLRSRPQPTPGRRQFLKAAGLALGAGLGWLALEGAYRVAGLAGARRRFTGSHERGSFDPEAMPSTQWLNDRPPVVDTGDHRVRVRVGDRFDDLSLTELDLGDRVVATLDCTSGWYSTQNWEGVRLDRLLPGDAQGSILVTSLTGYRRRFPIEDAGRLLLATRVGDQPLQSRHGAPVRLVAPGRRGFWWVKWVAEVQVDDRPAWWQSPFPLT